MGYNPNFRINPEQLEMIEDALRAEMGRLTEPVRQNWDDHCSNKKAALKINELLGHLHNQKQWYPSKDNVPQG